MQWRENWWKCCCTCTCLVGRHSMKAEEKQIKFQAQNALPGCLPSRGGGVEDGEKYTRHHTCWWGSRKKLLKVCKSEPRTIPRRGCISRWLFREEKKNVEEKRLPKKLRPGVAREHLFNTFYCMNEEWLLRSWQFKVRFCSQDDACTTLFIFIESIN